MTCHDCRRWIALAALLAATAAVLIAVAASRGTEERSEADPAGAVVAKSLRDATNSGWHVRPDVAMPGSDQQLLWLAAQEFRVDHELALAVSWRETGWNNVAGDGGNAVGYMQLQPRWCAPEMELLGAKDLSSPADNFRVGCLLLSRYIEDYGVAYGLTRYNTGHTGESEYARAVMEMRDKLKEAAR